ncbi:MAG: exodeoxyribonuclease VII large subunit [Clostridiales Family XIII bacterium]|jgi:exodeoxyribonuclease VII large subunit|nr:exodeoxyribonuclease VII large subunit [Clostridiales Family XIII bacterium]
MQPIKVSQLNSYIKRILGSDPILSNVSVAGEISGCKYHTNGHVYFTLKDENAAVQCFLPAGVLGGLRFKVSDGLGIVAHGYVNVYEKGGSYSLNIRDITVEGAGNLAEAFEVLKQKLREEGLFDASHKKPLPFFPKTIGVVTSPTGAAIRDMLKIITDRNDYANVALYPALVQGEGAAAEIAAGIRYFNERMSETDVIIIGRGGGSIEDLWAFNEESLARAVFGSVVPIVSAVGHETDVTITDLVADVRAETPTAAAALVAPDTREMRESLFSMRDELRSSAVSSLELLRERMESKNVSQLLHIAQERVETLRMVAQMRVEKLSAAARAAHTAARRDTQLLLERLNTTDPARIMALGYAAITGEGGRLIRSAASLTAGGEVTASFADGTAKMQVLDYNIKRKLPDGGGND